MKEYKEKLFTSELTFSTTSRKALLVLYLMPSGRQDILPYKAPVFAGRFLLLTLILFDSVFMYSFNTLVSVVWGYPWSIISSSNSYIRTKLSLMLSSSNWLKYSINISTTLCRNENIRVRFGFLFATATTTILLN